MKIKLALSVLALSFSMAAFAESPMPPEHEGHDMQRGAGEARDVTREEHAKRSAERFDKMDADHNGVLSVEERKAGHKKMQERHKERREKRKERRDERKPSQDNP